MKYNLHLDKMDWVDDCHTITHGGVDYKCHLTRLDGKWVASVSVGDKAWTSSSEFRNFDALSDALTQAGLDFAIR